MNPFKRMGNYIRNNPAQLSNLIRPDSEYNLTIEIKFFLYKIISKNLYLSINHYVYYRDGRKLIPSSPLQEGDHECQKMCLSNLRRGLTAIERILSADDFKLFLFVMDQFLEISLLCNEQEKIRGIVAEKLFPTLFPCEGKIAKHRLFLKYGTRYRETEFYHTDLETFEKYVGNFESFTIKGYRGIVRLFDPNFQANRTLLQTRTRRAKDFMRHIYHPN